MLWARGSGLKEGKVLPVPGRASCTMRHGVPDGAEHNLSPWCAPLAWSALWRAWVGLGRGVPDGAERTVSHGVPHRLGAPPRASVRAPWVHTPCPKVAPLTRGALSRAWAHAPWVHVPVPLHPVPCVSTCSCAPAARPRQLRVVLGFQGFRVLGCGPGFPGSSGFRFVSGFRTHKDKATALTTQQAGPSILALAQGPGHRVHSFALGAACAQGAACALGASPQLSFAGSGWL